MNTELNMEERLWEYIDGACPADEKLFIEQLIIDNREWKAKYDELLELQALLENHLELDEPSMRFTQNVMEEIGKHYIAPAAKSYINKRIVWGIAAFFILSIVGFLIYGFGQINWSQSGGSSFIDKINFSKFDLGKAVNSTYAYIFMMINVVLGLVCLDMYLGNKKKKILSNNH